MTRLILTLFGAWFVFLMALNDLNGNTQAEKTALLEPKKCNTVKPKPKAIKVAFVEPEQAKGEPKPEKSKKIKSSVTKSGAGHSNSGIGKRIDATYGDSESVINWLMAHGSRLLILDSGGQPIAELDNELLPVTSAPFTEQGGSWRQVDKEIRLLNHGVMPEGGAHAQLFWPNKLWKQVVRLAKKHQASHLKLRYSVINGRLKIKPLKALTINGKWIKNLKSITL